MRFVIVFVKEMVELGDSNQVFMVVIIHEYFILVLIAQVVDVLIPDNAHVLRNGVEREIYFNSRISLFMILQFPRRFVVAQE